MTKPVSQFSSRRSSVDGNVITGVLCRLGSGRVIGIRKHTIQKDRTYVPNNASSVDDIG